MTEARSRRHGVMNLYAYPDGRAYWGRPHASRQAAQNADRWCGWDGKRVVARCVVNLKKVPK